MMKKLNFDKRLVTPQGKGSRKAPEELTQKEKIKYLLLSIGIVATIGVLAVWFFNRGVDDTQRIEASLTQEEQDQAKSKASEFILSAGNFGMRNDQVDASNVYDASFQASRDPNSAQRYVITRSAAYENLRPDINPGSPLFYNKNEVAKWTNEIELNRLTGFSMDSATPRIESKPFFVSRSADGTGNSIGVDVIVDYTSLQRTVEPTANDSEWDGKYNVLEQKYDDSALVTMVLSGGSWKVHEIKDNEYPFVLSTWGQPNITDALSKMGQPTSIGVWQSNAPLTYASAPEDLKPTATPSPTFSLSDDPNGHPVVVSPGSNSSGSASGSPSVTPSTSESTAPSPSAPPVQPSPTPTKQG